MENRERTGRIQPRQLAELFSIGRIMGDDAELFNKELSAVVHHCRWTLNVQLCLQIGADGPQDSQSRFQCPGSIAFNRPIIALRLQNSTQFPAFPALVCLAAAGDG